MTDPTPADAPDVIAELTPFDTGAVLEPHTYGRGLVDFDNDESGTEVTLSIYRSKVEDDTFVLEVDSSLLSRLKIVVNDGTVATIDADGTPHYGD